MMQLFDCNLHLDQFKSPISIIKKYNFLNIEHIVSLCDNINSYNYLTQLLYQKKNILLGIGLHPNRKYSKSEIPNVLYFIKEKVRIIGECGLDFKKKINSKKIQYNLLNKQLNITEKYNKILILHVVNAEKEMLELLSTFNLKFVIFHWFSGDFCYIKKILDKGCYFSFNKCIINFKKYQNYISEIPVNRLLIESDAPFKYKGLTTKPEDFPKIVKTIAHIKLLRTDQVSQILFNNYRTIFIEKDINGNSLKSKNYTLDDFL